MENEDDDNKWEVREPAAIYGTRHLSVGQYLQHQQSSTQKYEYYKGEIFAMAGGKLSHNVISTNLLVLLGVALKGKSCRPFNSDQRIHIPSNTLFTYPDISVVCGEIHTLNNDQMNVLNPSVVVEVLSAGTKAYDRGEKFRLYQEIPSLREYILIDSDSINVQAHRLGQNHHWASTGYTKLSDTLVLPAIAVSLPLQDIYEGARLMGTTY